MLHPPAGSVVLLADPGDDSVVRPIKGTGCNAEKDQVESPPSRSVTPPRPRPPR